MSRQKGFSAGDSIIINEEGGGVAIFSYPAHPDSTSEVSDALDGDYFFQQEGPIFKRELGAWVEFAANTLSFSVKEILAGEEVEIKSGRQMSLQDAICIHATGKICIPTGGELVLRTK